MAKNKYKKGDKLRVLPKHEGECGSLAGEGVHYIVITGMDDGMYEYDGYTESGRCIGDCFGCYSDDHLTPYGITGNTVAPKEPKVNFILQYELDEDPFETFETMNEVKARIRELADDEDLQRDSIRVYTVSEMVRVQLDVSITFVKPEVPKVAKAAKVVTKKPAKRGRPLGTSALEKQRKAKKAAYMREYWRKRNALKK